MAATYHGFIDRFREFDALEIAQADIELAIAAASRRVNLEVWGEQWDDAVLLLAAHMVVNTHRVQCCKLINKDNSTGYLTDYTLMRESIISGDRVW